MLKLLLVLFLLGFGSAASAAAARTMSPDDSNLYYVGRFDHGDPAGPRCEWSHSSVTLRFRGTGVRVKLNERGDDDYEIVVDQQPGRVFHATPGEQVIDVATDAAAGEHRVQIIKRTEAFVGCGQFEGFELPADAELLPASRCTRRIEVIGDSISCGYGNEAPDEHVHFSPRTENATLAYGAVAARAVGAEYVCIAWSGKKLWPDNRLTDLYDRTLPTDPASQWGFTSPAPDVVLINLATNDFGQENPDEKGWTDAYERFVHRVRGHYPGALIYLASGTMMTDQWPPGQHAVTTLAGYLDHIQAALKAEGETRVRLLPFGVQDQQADGLGADYHPSVKTHQKMADKFVAALRADLGW